MAKPEVDFSFAISKVPFLISLLLLSSLSIVTPQVEAQSTDTVIKTIDGFNRPAPVAFNPFDHNMYVGNAGSNTISVIDTATNTIVRTMTAGFRPQGIAFNPINGLMYVTNGGDPCSRFLPSALPCDDTFQVIDPSTGTVLQTIPIDGNPIGVAFNPANSNIYIAAQGKPGVVCTCLGHVFIFDSATYNPVATIPVTFALEVAFNPVDGNIWAIETSDAAAVAVIESSTHQIIRTIGVGNDPSIAVFNPFNNKMYVPSPIPNEVAVIDASTYVVVTTVSVTGPVGGAFNPANNDVYVTNFAANQVTRISSSTNAIVGTIDVGLNPVRIAFNPANNNLYVSNVGDTTVSVIGMLGDDVCTPPPSGMVSWWPLDGNSDDIQDGNSGFVEGVGGQFVPARVGLGFKSAGQGGLVRVDDAPNLDVTQLTIDAWAKVDALNPLNMPILWKGDEFGTNIASPYTVLVIGDPGSLSVNPDGILSGTVAPGKVAFLVSNGLAEHILMSNSVLPIGSFSHVATTADGSKMRIYIDGQLDSEVDQVRTPYDSSFAVQIGSLSQAVSDNYFNGVIDEVEIFNRALFASEIQAIFNAGASGKCRALSVEIDIKPSSDPNSINPRSSGTIPVAILSDPTLDAPSQVDTSSLTFGHTGDEQSMVFCSPSPEDVNGDGLLDLVCHFDIRATGFGGDSETGILRGQLLDGTQIEGSDSVRIVRGGGGSRATAT